MNATVKWAHKRLDTCASKESFKCVGILHRTGQTARIFLDMEVEVQVRGHSRVS